MKHPLDTLPDDTPVISELAFPDGLAVFVGPRPGWRGTINWQANPVISAASRYYPATDMRRDYPNSVPVKPRSLDPTRWINRRWVAPERGSA